jgi:lipoate-protein ligase A
MHWRLVEDAPQSGADNMAIDERLLRDAANGEAVPTLRFYTWDPPAVSLGRFQDEGTAVDARACRVLGIDVVRRITGGRAVLHHRELTYSIVSRTDHSIFPNDLLGTYKVIAEGLLAGLGNLGIKAEMVSRSCKHVERIRKKTGEPACFASPSWYEILVGGKKIIGSAQRRVPGAFLQHGSILIDRDPSLEASVIPGGSGENVTSIREVLGRSVADAEVHAAFVQGFSDALRIGFAL